MNWIFLILLNRIYQIPFLLSVYKGLKYVIHVTTRTSEIYRLCNISTTIENEKEITVSKEIVYRIDRSIFYSKQLQEEKYQLGQPRCEINKIIQSVALKKEFPEESLGATQVLSNSINRIYETNQVLYEIEQRVRTKYDTSNPTHEEKLMRLWNLMKPDTVLDQRMSKQWVDIGFQGSDPATDFRGMGMQGLEDLLYFAENYPNHAKSVLQHASHPIHWYPYAIVGINITKFAYQVLEAKKLQLFLFQFGPTLNTFQDFYCYLFDRFNTFWIHHEPRLTVMDFEAKFIEFKEQVEKDLLLENITLL